MNTPDRKLTPAEIDAFGAELDALRARTVAKLGAEDAKYIRNIVRTVRYTEVAGRALLMAGIFPPAWILGTITLGVSKIIENMELGHNVMHAQYDWMNDPELNGQTYEWDTACTADHWRQTHNYEHHTYTNVMGKDHDIGYGVLRLFPEQKWEPRFLANPIMALLLMTLFQHLLALQSLQLEKLLSGEKTFAEVKEQAKPILKKMRKQIAKDYLLFPALAGPFFPIVFAGNVGANLIRNFWSSAIIFCGHFTEDAEVFPLESLENESRGHWYLRQLKGSSNLEGNKLMHIMSGNLSHQIEHHLFPDVPGRRYAEMSVEVREICKRYGQHYNSKPFFKQLGEVAGRILRHALPSKPSSDKPSSKKPKLVSKKASPVVREEELLAA
ncbi:linoleoyl-CoA desaturase [Panacagrimonas perspica]|uniref:Linoleoyl-CoA desaturase n=1 Tax=Panacagrimonas perspica TaxID=381431 RepID=A0A4R7P3X0_9GAMM|nr:acyl-CoA desaturase [Panacagrimonas perspica]TDU28069.1 linoleoyl-CoA desaturase [Panacagrimonas perspica]THD03485.1 acyl-CoA desaturase [Panacagrimonas perspica]